MKHQQGLLLSAVLLLVAGCGSVTPTSETSMLRGPTPSSGMTIPRLLTASGAPSSGSDPAQSDGPAASLPTESGAPGAADSAGPPTGATDSLGSVLADEPVPSDTGAPTTDPATGTVDLASVAAAFGCTDYLQQPAMPLTSSYGECMLDGRQVQLYAFASDQDSDSFLDQLATQGVSADQLVQGPKYLVSADPSQLDKIASALSAG